MSKTQTRGYETLKALFGHEVTGISCQALAERLGRDKSVVIKDLQTLAHAGLAEQLPDKTWRLSCQLAREAVKIMNGVNSARDRLEETATRYGMPL